jgi:hypothetical protein
MEATYFSEISGTTRRYITEESFIAIAVSTSFLTSTFINSLMWKTESWNHTKPQVYKLLHF